MGLIMRVAHDVGELCELFNATFANERTVLQGGAAEPEYVPWNGDEPARVIFTRDYFASALHEIAHWCIAGHARRQQRDYGYWYAPDGRTPEQQAAFAQVEAKPQGLEWAFHLAARHPFHVSCDNLDGDPGDTQAFAEAVVAAAQKWYERGYPPRAQRFIDALAQRYGGAVTAASFSLAAVS